MTHIINTSCNACTMDDDECKTGIPIGKMKAESDIWQKLNNVSITLAVTMILMMMMIMVKLMMMRIMIMMKITKTMMIRMMRFVTLSWADVQEESSSPFGF